MQCFSGKDIAIGNAETRRSPSNSSLCRHPTEVMGDDKTQDRVFIPFNFSAVLPFDSLSSAANELPTLRPVEPDGPFSTALPASPSTSPSHHHSDMARLIMATFHDEEWRRDISSDLQHYAAQPSNSPNQQWTHPFCDSIASNIQLSLKRANPMSSPVKRSTPKRPRPQHLTSSLSKSVRRSSASHGRQVNDTTPARARSSASTPQLSHAQELKRQEHAKIVDNENYSNFVTVLRSFVKRPQDLVPSDTDDHPDLLATASLSDARNLNQAVRLVSSQGVVGHVPSDLLSRVVAVLHTRVRHCIQKFGYKDSQREVLPSTIEASLGVLAATTILSIISAALVPRVLLVQELLEDLAQFVRCIANSIIFPMSDPLFRRSSIRTKRTKQAHHGGTTPRNRSVQQSQDESESDDALTSSKRSVLKKDENLFRHFGTLLDSFTMLFQKENHLPEEFVDKCATVCVQSVSVDGMGRLQSHAIRLVSMIFFCYPSRRLYILDEACESIKSLSVSRKHLRTFHLSEDQYAIRPSSALICLLLTTACNDYEEGNSRNSRGVVAEDQFQTWRDLRLKRYHRAMKLAVHVLEPLFEKVCSDRDVELRTAFQTFFEDLLTLYGRPEWPSAELMLQTLSVSIVRKLRISGDKSVYARVIGIETLGAIASKLCEVHGDSIVKGAGLAAPSPNLEKIECERAKVLAFLTQKDSLQIASAYSFLEALFLTDDHNMAANSRKRTASFDDSKQSADDSDENQSPACADVVQTYALARLEKVSEITSRSEDVSRLEAVAALQYVGAHRNFASGFKTIILAICECIHDAAPTIRAKSIKSLSSVESSCPGFLQVFPSVLPFIESSCRDVSILARDAALELVSRSLMPGSAHQNSTNSQDVVNIKLFDNIFEIVMKRMCDTATSVRKRAIGISRAVLSEALKVSTDGLKAPVEGIGTNGDFNGERSEERITRICTGLVQRLDDPENSVRELAERVLRFALFGYDPTNTLTWGRGNDAGGSPVLAKRLTNLYVMLPPNMHLSFMARVVHKALLIKERPLLMSIVSSSVVELHEYEAVISKMCPNRRASTMQQSELEQIGMLSKRRVACSSVICALGSLDASLIEPQCKSLAPSIKGVVDGSVSESDLLGVQRILNVLEVGLGQSGIADTTLINEVLSDVELIVCQSPTTVLEEASVRCFCVVAKKANLNQSVERSASAFQEYLDSQVDCVRELYFESDSQLIAFERHARCAVVRLGLLARFGSFEIGFTNAVYKTLIEFCNAVRLVDYRGVLSKACVRALSHFLIGHRSFLQDGTNIYLSFMEMEESSAQSGQDWKADSSKLEYRRPDVGSITAVKLCILQGFHELLRDEEDRNSSTKDVVCQPNSSQHDNNVDFDLAKKGSQKDVKAQPALAAEEDAEAGFLALSAQAMFTHVRDCGHSSSTVIRRTVANIVGLLVRQGLLLPANVVPCLFGLLLDQDTACREYAMRVVAFIADRHSGMLTSAIVPALQSCFRDSYNVQFQSELEEISMEKIVKVCIDVRNGHSLLSGAIMSLRREQRRGVLESLMREFDPKVIVVEKMKEEEVDSKNDELSATEVKVIGHGDEGDDNLGINGFVDMDVAECDMSGRSQWTLAALHFLAMTVACIDYTNGAGVGGSLNQGGGTAAAESRLKMAKEDVTELVGIATRIISNSGQAVLRLTKHVMCNDGPDMMSKKKKVAGLAAKVNLLLRLKYHLKVERWKHLTNGKSGNEDGAYEDGEVGDGETECRRNNSDVSSGCRMPTFQADMEVVSCVGWGTTNVEAVSEECANRQLIDFMKLMNEDAIDEVDVSSARRRGKSAGGRNSRIGRRRSVYNEKEKRGEDGLTTPSGRTVDEKTGIDAIGGRGSLRKSQRRGKRLQSHLVVGDEDDDSGDEDYGH